MSFPSSGQLDYNAWPIFSTQTDPFTSDSVVVLQFLDKTELLKYSFNAKPGYADFLPAAISDPLSGRLLIFTDLGNGIIDSTGRIIDGILESQNGHWNEGIMFRNYIGDTIYRIVNVGTRSTERTQFSKLTYRDSIEVWQDNIFATKYIHQFAMTRDSSLQPVLAFALKEDTLATDEGYRQTKAIDLYKLESGNLNLYSRLSIPTLNIGNNIEFSPNGEYLCLGTHIYQVNPNEARIMSEIDLTPFFQSRGIINPNLVFSAFSMDSRYLYIRHSKNYTYHDSVYIFQFDLSNWDATAVTKSAYEVYVDSVLSYESIRQIQLAPDGKIYGNYTNAMSNRGYLSVIVSPDKGGAFCQFEKHHLSLNALLKNRADSMSLVSFPNVSIFAPQYAFQLDLGPDTLLCVGDSLLLQATTPRSLVWSTGDTSSSLWVKTPGVYSAHYKYAYGAVHDTINVQFMPRPTVYIGPDTAFCDLVDYLIESESDGKAYVWNTGDTTKNLYVNHKGKYVLEVKSLNSCKNADTVEIEKFDSPFFRDLDTSRCEGDQIVLGPGKSNLEYNWSTGDSTSTLIANKSGIYTLKVRNQICEEEVTYTVHIIPEDSCIGSIYFPNTFTPNGDGFNPYFFPVGNNFEVQSFIIYNRWGQEIYTYDGQKTGWDGRYLGREVPEGVYFFTCTYTVLEHGKAQRVHTKGVIHVLR